MSKKQATNGLSAAADGSPPFTLQAASNLIAQQEYMLKRQDELVKASIARNSELVAAANALTREKEAVQRENHKLRKEIEGYKRGRIWSIIASMLPTTELRWRDE